MIISRKFIPHLVTLLVFIAGGMLGYKGYTIIPYSNYFIEAWLIISVAFFSKSVNYKGAILLNLLALYVTLKFLLSINSGVHVLDFVIAHKFISYIVLLIIFNPNKPVFDSRTTICIFRLIAIAMLIKYIVWFMIVNNRPGLFTENNFELMFLGILYIVLQEKRLTKPFDLVILLSIFILSGSRSGLMSLALILAWYSVFKRPSITRYMLFGSVFPLLLMTALQRIPQDLSTIDRVKFLLLFIETMSMYEMPQILFGSMRLKPLPQEICNNFAFYKGLFSSSGDGSCYSVVFHSFLLRAVHDFGAVGTYLIGLIYYKILIRSFSFYATTLLIGVLIFNSLSVSGPSNVFVFAGLLIGIATMGRRESNEDKFA